MSSSSFEFLFTPERRAYNAVAAKWLRKRRIPPRARLVCAVWRVNDPPPSHWKQSRLLCIMGAGDGSVTLLSGLEAKE
jgi:hypothetical protein